MTNVVDFFIELVKIPSPLYKVGAIQQFLKTFILNLYPDAEIIMDQVGNEHPEFEAGNVLINIPASHGLSDLPVIAVEAHVDTVKEDGKIIPIVDQENGLITSDYTTILGADDKAGVAAICAALENIKSLPHGPLQIIFSVGEEASMYGMRQFDFNLINAKQILCVDGFQPNHIINACAGKIKYRAGFVGRAAHGAEPEKGINAINLAAIAVTKCITNNLTGRLENGVIHNVAEIQSHEGASQYPSNNTIPGKCYIAGELRGLNKNDLNSTWKEVRHIMVRVATEYCIQVNFDVLIPYEPFNLDPLNSKLVTRLKEHNFDYAFEFESCDGSTHANIYNQHGIESVVIGAGARNPHGQTEYLIISELEAAVKVVTNYLYF